MGLLIAFAHGTHAPWWPLVVLAHAVGMAAVHGLARWGNGPGAHPGLVFARDFYPILFYTALYNETGLVNQMLGVARFDPQLIRAEHALFGIQPSIEFMRALPYLLFSELMHAAYFSYYLMIVGVGGWLWWKNRAAFRHFVGVISFVFYACYATYLFVPAVGPRTFFQTSPERDLFLQLYGRGPTPVPDSLQHGPFFLLMQLIYEHLETWGAAFPSSHVAVALATAWFSWRYVPGLRWVHLVAAGLLCTSIVYGRYHYVIDGVAGVLACAILLPLGNWLYWKTDGRAPQSFRS